MSLLLPMIGLGAVALLNNGSDLRLFTNVTLIVIFLSITCAISSFVCVFKLHKWKKTLPILGVIVGIVTAFLADFSRWFSGYGS